MKKLLPFIFLLSIGFTCLAQQTDEQGKERIQQIQNLIAEKENSSIQAVTKTGNRTEFWSFAELGDSIRSFEIKYYEDENLYTEYYAAENGKLIFAFEEERFIPYNHTPQRIWNCAYYLKDEKIFYHISLGHGKTEDNSWEPDDIVVQFRKRLTQKEMMRDSYNPDN